MAETIRVSRALYRQALDDAIEYTVSLIQAGNPDPEDRRRLARYRQAWTAAGFERPAEPPYAPVTLAELAARNTTTIPKRNREA